MCFFTKILFAMIRAVILFVILALKICVAFSQEIPPLLTDRPGQSDATSIVPQAAIQLEMGLNKRWKSELLNLHFNDFTSGGLVRIGVLPWLEGRIQQYHIIERQKTDAYVYESNNVNDPLIDSPSSLESDLRGLSALNLGAKALLTEGSKGWKPEVAVLYDINLLPGSRKFGQPQFVHTFKLLVAHQITDWNIGYNLVRSYYNGKGNDLAYTLSVSKAITDELGLYLEGFGDFPFQGIAKPFKNQAINTGATYLLAPRTQVDLFVGKGLTSYAYAWMLGGGVSIRINK